MIGIKLLMHVISSMLSQSLDCDLFPVCWVNCSLMDPILAKDFVEEG